MHDGRGARKKGQTMSATSSAVLPRSLSAALACLFIVGGLLGLSINIAKLAVIEGMSPVTMLFWAALGSGILLQFLGFAMKQSPKINSRTIEYGLFSGLLFAIPNIVALLAIRHIGAGLIALTFAFPNLFTYVFALLLKMEIFIPARALGVLFGLAGAVLLAIPRTGADDPAVVWFAVAMTSPVLIALGNIYRTIRWPVGETALSLAPMMLIGGALATLAIMAAFGWGPVLFAVPTHTGLILIGTQTVVFSVMYGLYFVLQRLAGPVYLSQIGSVAAAVGGSIAIGLLGETLPANLPIAAILIGAGVVLVSQTARWMLPRVRRHT